MNQQQLMSLVRAILQVAGTFVTTYGVMTGGQWESVSGVVLVIVPVVWGVITHTEANMVANAAAIPEVEKVEVRRTPAGRQLASDAGSTPSAMVTIAPH